MTLKTEPATEVHHELLEREHEDEASDATVAAPVEPSEPAPPKDDASDEVELDGVFPEQYQQVIAQVSMSMEWLTDLRTTIERRGVSAHDMQALREIRGTLEGVGVEFSPTPSLEHYPLGSYTEERSSVNLEPALESLARTIVTTIKNWIRKLVEYIKRLSVWFKRNFRREDWFAERFQTRQTMITAIRQGRVALEKSRTTRPGKELEKLIADERQGFLQNDALKRSPLQLAALGDGKRLAEIKELSNNTVALARNTEQFVDAVEDVLANNPHQSSNIDTSALTLGGMLVDDAKVLQGEMPQRQYLKQHVNPEIFNDLAVIAELTEVTPYDYLEALYADLTKQLTQIRKISDDLSHENFNNVPKLLKEVSTNVDQLSQLATFFYGYNVMKHNTLMKLSSHEHAVFNLVYSDAVKTAPDTRARETLERIKNQVQATLEKNKSK